MIKTILKNSYLWLIIIGCIGWAFGLTYTGLSIVSQETVNYGTYNWTFYRINVYAYIKSIETAINGTGIENIFPNPPTFTTTPNWADILSILKWFVNTGVIYVTNCIIFVLDYIIVVPTQLVLYPVNLIYALLGLNTADQSWIQAINTIYNWQIPYIPYI